MEIRRNEEIAICENRGVSEHGLVRDRPLYAILDDRFTKESPSNG